MILLIEGVNAVGKSTLAKQLADDLDWPILKFNVPPDCAFEHFSGTINDWTIGSKAEENFIIDRCHLSNWAYRGLLGGDILTLDEWTALDEQLRHLKTWLFLLVDDPFAIEQRLQERTGREDGANALNRHTLVHIQQRFVEASGMSRIEVQGHFTLPQLLDPETGEPTNQYYQILEQILRENNEQS